MLNLIKYEFSKKYKMFTVFLIATVLANIYFTVKLGQAGFAPLAVFLALGLLVLYVIDVVQMYSKDINKKTGYMVFMTPNSGYKIIISKILTALIEGFVMLTFYIVVLLLNTLLIYGEANNIVILNTTFNSAEFIQHLFIVLFAAILYLVQFIMVVYTALTLSKSIFANSKYKGIISFGFFLVINYITTSAYWTLYRVIGFNMHSFSGNISPAMLLKLFSPAMLLAVVLSSVLIAGSGYLLEKKINL